MYTYIHIPFCKSKCTYCDFYSVVLDNDVVRDDYVTALLEEAAYRVKKHNIHAWKSLYIGGGTPSLLTKNQVARLMAGLVHLCPLEKNAEVTFEVNPCDIAQKGLDYLLYLSENDINRMSCGIQSLDDTVLSCVKRRSSAEECMQALNILSKWRNMQNEQITDSTVRPFQFSVDAIAGLPKLPNTTFINDLSTLLSFKPDHVSLYSLMIEEGTALCDQIDAGSLNFDYDFADEQWLIGKAYLEKNGYHQYEISNFAYGNDTLCEGDHNKAYWRMDDYIGLGSTACGTVGSNRFTGTKDIEAYCDSWIKCTTQTEDTLDAVCLTEHLSKDEQIFEFLMMGFRTNMGVSEKDFFKRFNVPLEGRIGSVFCEWKEKGLADTLHGYWFLTAQGLLQLNRFLSEIV